MDQAEYYGKFLERQREEKKIEPEALGQGIFSESNMRKIECGERYPDKQTRDRLLARLGESGYDYECFLQLEEYQDWEERRNILDSLDNLELYKAEQLLKKYEQKASKKEPVVQQFLLTMRLQWMVLKGVPEKERCRVLETAVKLTVPEVDEKPVAQLVLSAQELNLVLEYYFYKRVEQLPKLCVELLRCLENNSFDMESKAMLGAKIALYYCNALNLAEGHQNLNQALDICTNGIEKLRDHQKIYFAWELLQKKEQYIKQILKSCAVLSEEKLEDYQKELEQTGEFFQLIDGLYETYQIPKETNGFTCFYREHEIYCINDVIRARRRMLGVSRVELEKTMLGKSTIKRLEKNETNLQMFHARKLFERFQLSIEMQRAQIITDSQEAIQLEKEFRWENNQRNYDKAEALLNKLRCAIPMNEQINRQYIFFFEKRLAYAKGKLNREEFVQYAKEALEFTLPLSVALAEMKEERTRNGKVWPKEKYLTNMEVTILYNIAREQGSNKINKYWEVLKEYFAWMENKYTLSPIIGMYGLVMSAVASRIGNGAQYEESSAINRKILRELLRIRSFSYAHGNMYGLLWNERRQQGLPTEREDPDWCRALHDIIVVDRYCKNEWLTTKVRKRLEE